jgi:RNA polymerase sigma-70 factor (ECF subfamily)
MSGDLEEKDLAREFEAIALPHLDAAYNLARWLTRDEQQAQDVVQAAFLRAFRFFASFRGGDARAWLFTIVRHTYYSALRDGRHEQGDVSFDEEAHGEDAGTQHGTALYEVGADPESVAEARDTVRLVNDALERLPEGYREIVVLKEMEDLSYKEIAEIAGIPIGTVMSRLARGRKLLGDYLRQHAIGG